MTKKQAVFILGAGPAGLAAAQELAAKKLFQLNVLEKDDKVGGISRTESDKGYSFDIGGHRFFTKSNKIAAIWHETLGSEFLTVQRQSRIFYNHKFFQYPLKFWNTLLNLGVTESIRVSVSYVKAILFPFPQENSFEEWTINRFGKRLFLLFFKSYTEKVWGIPCSCIQSDWAAQRIKGLSFASAVINAVFKTTKATSLIDEFFYPRLGPGMMWEKFRERITLEGGSVKVNARAVALHHQQGIIRELTFQKGGDRFTVAADQVISSIPLDCLIAILDPPAPPKVIEAAKKISYRAFIIVVLIVAKKEVFSDQWLYIHAPEVNVGRIQNFKNWSLAMVPDENTTSLGMEYFCSETDEIWARTDQDLVSLAAQEIELLGLVQGFEIVDSYVMRQPKAYPVYDEGYKKHLEEIKKYLQQFENFQTVGRNGMHRYNNMDHSMLSGIMAAENLMGSRHDIWEMKDPEEYLEENLIDRAPGMLASFRRPVEKSLALAAVIVSISLLYCFW